MRQDSPFASVGERRPGDRLASLDGLRGLAALVVVVHHALMTWQVLAAQYQVVNTSSATWWLVFTPLHLLWAGGEAVLVFFVLSGFVLTASALRARGGSTGWWRGYYASRFLRLYIPVWVSLALACALAVAFPRTPLVGSSWWFDLHTGETGLSTLLSDALLVDGVSWLHPSLWSLRFEVLFSLLLPLYVVLVGRRSVPWWVPAIVSLLVIGLAQRWGHEAVSWLGVFGLGASMAAGREPLRAIARRCESALCWTGILGVAIGLLLAEWWVRGLGLPLETWACVVRPASAAGGGIVVFAALGCRAFRRSLEGRSVQWLGKVSFSLYLVHEPIVVSIASKVGGGRPGVALTLVVGVVVALGVAAVFHRWVEVPAVLVARRVGNRVRADRQEARRSVTGAPVSAGPSTGQVRRVLPPVPPLPPGRLRPRVAAGPARPDAPTVAIPVLHAQH